MVNPMTAAEMAKELRLLASTYSLHFDHLGYEPREVSCLFGATAIEEMENHKNCAAAKAEIHFWKQCYMVDMDKAQARVARLKEALEEIRAKAVQVRGHPCKEEPAVENAMTTIERLCIAVIDKEPG